MSDSKHKGGAPSHKPGGAHHTKPTATSHKPAASAHPADEADNKQSGRVAFDSRGNPIWEWQTSTGVFDKNVSTQRLKKLESPELTLADTQPVPVSKPKGLAVEDAKRKGGDGFNPYNSGLPVSRNNKNATPAAHPALVHKNSARPAPKPSPRRAEPVKEESTWQKLKSKLTGD